MLRSIYLTPKGKSRSSIPSSSSTEVSPGDEVVAAFSPTESLTKKLDLILARLTMTNERLTKLDEKMNDLNQTVNGLQTKVSYIETDVVAVKKSRSLLIRNRLFPYERKRTREKQISMNAVNKSFIWKPTVAGKTCNLKGYRNRLKPQPSRVLRLKTRKKVLVNFIEDTQSWFRGRKRHRVPTCT